MSNTSSQSPRRIGLIVPSSNTTIETELPEMLARRGELEGERYTFHSSRAVLHEVTAESLERMVGQLDRCVNELADANTDAVIYACLVALMAQGAGAHVEAERTISQILDGREQDAVVSSSAGALVRALRALGLERVAIITPYLPPLTEAVAQYLEAEGFVITERVSLSVANNVEVGRLDEQQLLEHALKLDLSGSDGLIISACVQMPSLHVIPEAEEKLGLPVISAATAGVFDLLDRLGLETKVPDAGRLLSGDVRPA